MFDEKATSEGLPLIKFISVKVNVYRLNLYIISAPGTNDCVPFPAPNWISS